LAGWAALSVIDALKLRDAIGEILKAPHE